MTTDTSVEAERVQRLADIEATTRAAGQTYRKLQDLNANRPTDLAALRTEVILEREGAEQRLAEAKAAWQTHHREKTEAEEMAEAGMLARREAEAALTRHYGEHFEYYAEKAEGLTQKAHTALLAVESLYGRAQQAWADASNAWALVNKGLIATAQAPIGGVEQLPHLSPELFALIRSGQIVARPRSMKVEHEVEVIEA